ncbi:MAG: 50S ribosomal protein L15 [Candidatus Zixiibacteriota bacterium]|nr:MAG: 50S ribosomal protein L15 [candidate division Zixibacteria bacterium]
MFNLSNLKPSPGSVKNRKRLGRGPGSGTGKTSGKGHKGQKSRSGYKSKPWNEGGQMPLQRRLPKRGFTNIFRTEYQEIAVSRLASLGIENITPEVLLEKKAVSRKGIPVKILGNGEIDKAVSVKAHAFSKSAIEKIEKAGGKIEIIRKNKKRKKKSASESGGGETG